MNEKGNNVVREKDLVAIFNSIHRVLQAEKQLKEADADFLLIPVPRQLTADCGLALRIAPSEWEEVFAVLSAGDLLPVEVYRKEGQSFHLCK